MKSFLDIVMAGGLAVLLKRYADVALAGVVVLILSMFIVPVPPFVLDLLITINISISTVTGPFGLSPSVGTGLFIDTFTCDGSEAVLWMHGYGNVFELTLQPGEVVDIEAREVRDDTPGPASAPPSLR